MIPPTLSTFLNLPREIRDNIYLSVLHTPLSPTCQTHFIRSAKHRPGIAYPSTTHTPCLSLLLCSHQIRSETLHVLAIQQRVNSDKVIHRLDCTVRYLILHPSWTLFPAPPTDMKHLEVDLRFFNVEHVGGLFWGCGGPSMIFKPLFELLNRFVHHGYQFFCSPSLSSQPHLESLIINLTWVNEDNFDYKIPMRRILESREQAFKFVSSHLGQIVRMGLLTGKVERIGARYGDMEDIEETAGFEAGSEVGKEWNQWGFHWGVDPSFTQPDEANATNTWKTP
ncbi:MAG: hypothetical protein Q9218_008118 [Villophora microphyllina]